MNAEVWINGFGGYTIAFPNFDFHHFACLGINPVAGRQIW